MDDKLREAHDKLLKSNPEKAAAHDIDQCIFCTENSEEGGDMKTFTEEELNAAVTAAVAPIKAELDTLKSAQAEGEVDTRVAEAKAEADERIAEVQAQLDAAVAEKSVAEKELEETVKYLNGVAEELAEEEAAGALRASRLETIEEMALYDADFIESKIDFWVSLSDEDFASLVENIKFTAEKAAEKAKAGHGEETEESTSTALDSTRDEAASESHGDVLDDILGARHAGVDIHSIY